MTLRAVVAGLVVAVVLLAVLAGLFGIERRERLRLEAEAERLETEIERAREELGGASA